MRLRDLFMPRNQLRVGYQPIATNSKEKATPPKNPNGDDKVKMDAKTAINNQPLALIKGTPEYEKAVVFNDVMRIIQLHSKLECEVSKKALGEALYHIHKNSHCTKDHHFKILKELTDEKQLEFYVNSIKERSRGGCMLG